MRFDLSLFHRSSIIFIRILAKKTHVNVWRYNIASIRFRLLNEHRNVTYPHPGPWKVRTQKTRIINISLQGQTYRETPATTNIHLIDGGAGMTSTRAVFMFVYYVRSRNTSSFRRVRRVYRDLALPIYITLICKN